MATTSRTILCRPSDVFAVLADGWLYGLWVVGASRIRDVSPEWPAVGARIHHSVGSWPALIDDSTSVREYRPDAAIVLRARAWPAGEADVMITAEAIGSGCRVTIVEDAVSGPGRLVPRPIRSAALHWRNTEALRRLDYLVRGRSAGSPERE